MSSSGTEVVARVLVFAKAPEPGAVKTRLIPALGAARAAALHALMVRATLATLRRAAIGPVELCCAPSASHEFFVDCAREFGVALSEQGEGDLGARMGNALHRALARERFVLLVGCDCPVLGEEHLRQAVGALAGGAHAAFAPAQDGGYALIGLRAFSPEIFRDIAWGGRTVMARTREHLKALGWTWRELDAVWDVDRPEDLDRLARTGLDWLERI